MLAADDTILYVGKARHLKNRVSSYFHGRAHADKTQAMLAQVARVEVTVTASETEALLLEYNLIKQHRPRYNVLLKDDKSFPVHPPHGARVPAARVLPRRGQGAGAILRAVSRIRSRRARRCSCCRSCSGCGRARTRSSPIARGRACSTRSGAVRRRAWGSCTREVYAQDIADAVQVLQGRNTELMADLGRRMEGAAERLQFESAARFRDQIAMLKQIQASQSVTRISGADIDAVAIAGPGPEFCVSVVFVRGGRNLGSTNFFPRGGLGGEAEALAGFLAQYYLARESPDEILVEPSGRGRRRARGGVAGTGRSRGADPQRRARHARTLAGHGTHQRGARTQDEGLAAARACASSSRHCSRRCGSSGCPIASSAST